MGIWIHWGRARGGGGEGELYNIARLFCNRKRAKGKKPRIQEWEPGMQCMGDGRSGPLPPTPNISQQRREVVLYRHYIVCQEML